mmetsp:Transcript_12599/g.33835  ORF Transcript_12599/g.33835 Transcript_12599/m.33835 type:complete len:268 (-) Transcript_12599:259-1062(-)
MATARDTSNMHARIIRSHGGAKKSASPPAKVPRIPWKMVCAPCTKSMEALRRPENVSPSRAPQVCASKASTCGRHWPKTSSTSPVRERACMKSFSCARSTRMKFHSSLERPTTKSVRSRAQASSNINKCASDHRALSSVSATTCAAAASGSPSAAAASDVAAAGVVAGVACPASLEFMRAANRPKTTFAERKKSPNACASDSRGGSDRGGSRKENSTCHATSSNCLTTSPTAVPFWSSSRRALQRLSVIGCTMHVNTGDDAGRPSLN